MKPITEAEIRGSCVNATKGEIDRMRLRGYLVHWLSSRPIGILPRASEIGPRPGISAMCSFMSDITKTA